MTESTKQFTIVVQHAPWRLASQDIPGYSVGLVTIEHSSRLTTRQEFVLEQFLVAPTVKGNEEILAKKYEDAVSYANTLGALLGITVMEGVSDGTADR